MRKTLLACALLCSVTSACARLTVTTPPAACAKLVPQAWKAGVEATPIPEAPPAATGLAECASVAEVARPWCVRAAVALAEVKAWSGAYVSASADLEKANGRTADTIDIFGGCEAMVNAARVKR